LAYEEQAFILRIKELENCLEESRKLYNLTKESDYAMRSMILREIDSISVTLAMSKNENQLWKQHRVTISKSYTWASKEGRNRETYLFL
jgi:predicted Zn-dependent protease